MAALWSLSAASPYLSLVFSRGGLHILHEDLREGTNPPPLHLLASLIPGVNPQNCVWKVCPLPPQRHTHCICAYFTITLGTTEQEYNIVSYVTIYLFWLRAASGQIWNGAGPCCCPQKKFVSRVTIMFCSWKWCAGLYGQLLGLNAFFPLWYLSPPHKAVPLSIYTALQAMVMRGQRQSTQKKKMLTASENDLQSQPQELSLINTIIYILGTVLLMFF